MWATVIGFVAKSVQLKISFIGFNKNAVIVLGKKTGTKYKIAEVGVAVLTFGIRITVRV